MSVFCGLQEVVLSETTDLHGLLPESERRIPVDVLNGIVYDKRRNQLFVTGKLWPKLFEIDLFRRDSGGRQLLCERLADLAARLPPLDRLFHGVREDTVDLVLQLLFRRFPLAISSKEG